VSHGFGRADTYLGQELARLDVGPLRACYLVPDHDRGRLIEARDVRRLARSGQVADVQA